MRQRLRQNFTSSTISWRSRVINRAWIVSTLKKSKLFITALKLWNIRSTQKLWSTRLSRHICNKSKMRLLSFQRTATSNVRKRSPTWKQKRIKCKQRASRLKRISRKSKTWLLMMMSGARSLGNRSKIKRPKNRRRSKRKCQWTRPPGSFKGNGLGSKRLANFWPRKRKAEKVKVARKRKSDI